MNPLLGRQLNLLFQRSRLELIVQSAASIVATGLLFDKIPPISLAAWLVGLLAILGLRLLLGRVYLGKSKVAEPSIWHNTSALMNLITGSLWGILALVQQDISSITQVGLMVTTAAVCAVLLWSTASSAINFPAFMLGLLVPWGVILFQDKITSAAAFQLFAGISVVYLGLFLLVNRQAMELVRMQSAALRTPSVIAAQALSARPVSQTTNVRVDTTLSTVSLAERDARPYLGLKRRASDHRGDSGLADAPIKGSRFGQIKIHDIATPEPKDPADCCILVVEDNLDNQLVALHLLQKRGYKVVIANNGREALAAVERQRFELILMDIQMPEMGGLEATAAIRLKEKHGSKRIPIIALTANPVSESREICLAAGMDDYLNKPISRTRLFAALDAQLKNKPRPEA
jgi:CheY-like chemotaxis protein